MKSPRLQRALRVRAWFVAALLSFVLVALLGARWWFSAALDGEYALRGLSRSVIVESDALGTPVIRAESQHDALRALGYVTARDRLFQMDLLRRQAAGELAEIFGEELFELDAYQRHLGMQQAARAITARLPKEQRAALDAYVQGVNGYIANARTRPPEMVLLGYQPRPWRAEDSMLVVLGIFQVLNGSEGLERTRTLLQRKAESSLVQLAYDTPDPFTAYVVDTLASNTTPRQSDSSTFAGVVANLSATQQPALLHERAGEARPGSNAWAVSGKRTRDGRAILANDMHLDLAVPNVWYRAELHYQKRSLQGVVLPGVPVVLAGSNGHVAWGLTNLEGDVLDLIELEQDPAQADHYLTASGPRRFVERAESIAVSGQKPRSLRVRSTMWGPVTPRKLLGRDVAVRWTALDPTAVDLGLLAMDRAQNVDDAVAVMNRAGMPPLNALLADAQGRIAWTITGKIPRRTGYDGASASSWASGARSWQGYLEPLELPRIIDPQVGFLVNANQPMPITAEASSLGHDLGNGYRAYRITERLLATPKVDERALFDLQLDSRSELYDLYRDVALLALEGKHELPATLVADLRAALTSWKGNAEVDSTGLALLVRFRRALMQQIMTGWFGSARATEPEHVLDFADLDTPVRAALAAADDKAFAFHPGGRNALIRAALAQAAKELSVANDGRALREIRWGDVSRVEVEHPLGAIPVLGSLLNMNQTPLAGCGACVRMAAGTLGASERLVVSPGHERDALFHMPGGESGNPFSPHYGDQQAAWVQGKALPLHAGPALHTLRLTPAKQ